MTVASVSVVVDISVPVEEFNFEQADEEGGLAITCTMPRTSRHSPLVGAFHGDWPNLEKVLEECARHIHDFPDEHQ